MSGTENAFSSVDQEYQASADPCLIDVSAARYLVIEGMGDPEQEVYRRRLDALMAVACQTQSDFESRGRSYLMGLLEVFFWGVMGPGDFFIEPRSDWNWRLLLRIPDYVRPEHVATAVDALRVRGAEPEVSKVRVLDLHEGRCVQVLHLGGTGEVRESVEKMSEYVRERGLSFHGLHHEIYLGDPRDALPESQRTIVRMPVC